MNSESILFKYNVLAEYIGGGVYPLKEGDRVHGVLSFNFDTGAVKLSVSFPDKPLEFTYSTWNNFELEWMVIERS